MLSGDTAQASSIAAAAMPFHLTRSLATLRSALRDGSGLRAGLLASSHARRLRAEGMGSVLPHQDEDAVARWFLDRWPDIRSADALEVAATEFGVQGLELDQAGVCWDVDLVRVGASWQARNLRGSAWTVLRGDEALSNRLNAYRVLLTRARIRTVVWVPRGDQRCGDQRDATRDPAAYDAIAAHLLACGIADLDGAALPSEDRPMPDPVLL